MYRTRLQRHRLIGEGIPAEEAARASLREGDRWIARAMPVLGDCGKPYTITRWNEWLRHADFPAVHAAYSRLARSDPVLSAAIAADIDGFIARQVKHGGGIADTSAVRTASRAYLDRGARRDHVAGPGAKLGADLSRP